MSELRDNMVLADESTAKLIRRPATGLQIAAKASIALYALSGVLSVVKQLKHAPPSAERALVAISVAETVTIAIVGAVLGFIVLKSSDTMRKIEGRTLALIGSVMALIPCFIHPVVWIFSFPIGIWSIFVLMKSQVRIAFSEQTDLESGKDGISIWWVFTCEFCQEGWALGVSENLQEAASQMPPCVFCPSCGRYPKFEVNRQAVEKRNTVESIVVGMVAILMVVTSIFGTYELIHWTNAGWQLRVEGRVLVVAGYATLPVVLFLGLRWSKWWARNWRIADPNEMACDRAGRATGLRTVRKREYEERLRSGSVDPIVDGDIPALSWPSDCKPRMIMGSPRGRRGVG